MPPKKKTLTGEQLAEMETLSAALSQDQIADYFGITRPTLAAIMEREPEVFLRYKKGRAKAINDIGSSLIMEARGGNIAAMMFYLKTQAGWREKSESTNEDVAAPLTINYTVSPPVKEIKITRGE